MLIFPPYLDRPRVRRESAAGDHNQDHDQVDAQTEIESIMSTTPDQLNHSGLRRGRRSPSHLIEHMSRDLSEESIRTELCEGPIYDSPPNGTPLPLAQTPDLADDPNRAMLLERLRRGQSPTWISNRHVRRITLHTAHLTLSLSPCFSYEFVARITNKPSANSLSRGVNKSCPCLLPEAQHAPRPLAKPMPAVLPHQGFYRPLR